MSRSAYATETVKGLEYDAVVVVQPGRIEENAPSRLVAASDLYVAMTRPTQRLVIVRTKDGRKAAEHLRYEACPKHCYWKTSPRRGQVAARPWFRSRDHQGSPERGRTHRCVGWCRLGGHTFQDQRHSPQGHGCASYAKRGRLLLHWHQSGRSGIRGQAWHRRVQRPVLQHPFRGGIGDLRHHLLDAPHSRTHASHQAWPVGQVRFRLA